MGVESGCLFLSHHHRLGPTVVVECAQGLEVTVFERHNAAVLGVEDLVKVRHKQRKDTGRDAQRW